MNNRLDDAINNILSIDWNNISYKDKNSYIMLAKEYLRRAAVFKCSLSLDCSFPFFNAANAIEKKAEVTIAKNYNELKNIERQFFRMLCEAYLEWAALQDEEEPIAVQFHDLYEPLFKIFKRGGSVGLHHGEFVVGKWGIQFRNYSKIAGWEPIDISDESLDKYDME